MTKRHLIIATRKSPLALIQAETVKALLMKNHSYLSVEILGITTSADKKLDLMLTTIGGKGLFVKELEDALLDGRADIAVHSMKDVPMSLPPGLVLNVICERVDPRDVFVSDQYQSLSQLPVAATVGTSSLRRQTQLRALRADINFNFLRGNINTRLSKLDNGDFAAIILAGAGLKRLHLTDRIRNYFSIEECLPAAGQGALGIQCREDDDKVLSLIAPLNHESTFLCVSAERAVCEVLNGGCQAPIAAFAEIHHDVLTLRGLVANRSGTRILRAKLKGEKNHAREIGLRVAEVLIQQGAKDLLRDFL
jgi:hydroxymethylbilane synthase